MKDKFTIEDLFMKIIPGGVMLGMLYFTFGEKLTISLEKGLDFFYTFMFFTFSYLLGEIIQTISHELEWMVFSFFKFYKPSEIFLYKENPVLKNELIRSQILKVLEIPSESEFNISYKSLPLFRKRQKQKKAQSFFWQLYSNISDLEELKTFNRNYLLVRAILVVCLSSAIIFFIEENRILMYVSSSLWLFFLWRARGMARTLVFKTVLLNLKNK